MLDFAEFTALRSAIERRKADADRARWRLEEILKSLKASLGVQSLKEAKSVLREMRIKHTEEQEKCIEDLSKLREKWASFLGDE